MQANTYEIIVDVSENRVTPLKERLKYFSGDYGKCAIDFKIKELSQAYDLSYVDLKLVLKSDTQSFQQDLEITDAENGFATIILDNNIISKPATYDCQLQAYDRGSVDQRRTIAEFSIRIAPSYLVAETVEGSEQYDTLTEFIVEAKNVLDRFGVQLENGQFGTVTSVNGAATNVDFIEEKNAIKSIETTDSEGKKTSFLIGTKTDLIETRTGHTEEERYTALLNKFGKKFTSTGENITVANAIENQRVLGAVISGQTIKNYLNKLYGVITHNSSSNKTKNIEINQSIQPSTKYKILLDVKELTQSVTLALIGLTDSTIQITKTGRNEFDFTTRSSISSTCSISITQGDLDSGRSVSYEILGIVEIDKASIVSNVLGVGLNSTQAVISNNGLKYSFYASLEDKEAGKVIDLGGVGGLYDTFEILKDGSGVYTQNIGVRIWDDNQEIIDDGTTELNHKYRFTFSKMLNGGTILLSNRYRFMDWNSYSTLSGKEAISCGGNNINISVLKTYANTQTELKEKLKENPIIIYYQLATPIVTHIPKELVQAIATEATNEFSFGDAVKPSSVEITVAIDQQEELNTLKQELAEIKALLASPSNLAIVANYAEDEYQACLDSINN